MVSVGAYEAKTHLPRLLEQVEGGETVIITRHGREVAKLVPADPMASKPADVIAELRLARQAIRRGTTPVRQMIEDGRR